MSKLENGKISGPFPNPFLTDRGISYIKSYKAPRGKAMVCLLLGTVPEDPEKRAKGITEDVEAIMREFGWIRDPSIKEITSVEA